MERYLKICIDGPSASGKSTIGRMLAEELSYSFLSTGKLYRSLAWRILDMHVDYTCEKDVASAVVSIDLNVVSDGLDFKFIVDTIDVSDRLNTEDIGAVTSRISAYCSVRERLILLQRKIGGRGGVILEGRDIGTVIMPDADVKFFLDASYEERGRRRFIELDAAGVVTTLSDTVEALRQRDKNDSERGIAPLIKAEDAVYIDSTGISPEELLRRMLSIISLIPDYS